MYAVVNTEEVIPPVYEPTYTDIDTLKVSPPTEYNIPKFDPKIPPTLPVSVDDLGTHVATCHSNGFEEQYEASDHYINHLYSLLNRVFILVMTRGASLDTVMKIQHLTDSKTLQFVCTYV